MVTLDKIKVGERGVVRCVDAKGNIKRRLFDMGVTPGVEIVMRRAAPMGDPIEISVRGYELMLRRQEASCVVLEGV